MNADPKLSDSSEQADTASFSATTDFNYCGIIMPIAAMGDYEKGHWERVRQIIDRAINDAGFSPKMVSESADIGVIHSRIVQNIYNNPIVVCDVSGKNPNVMFELGLRLAFDKPVIIIKDDKTNYSFDTSPIEHLEYRQDLRYQDSLVFIEKLTARINATVVKSRTDNNYSPFLRHFGTFKVAELEQNTGSAEEVILTKLDELQRSLGVIANLGHVPKNLSSLFGEDFVSNSYNVKKNPKQRDIEFVTTLANNLSKHPGMNSLDDLVQGILPLIKKSGINWSDIELKSYLMHNVSPALTNSQGNKLY